MASPIMTSGFNVSERPGISLMDPRLLTANLSALVPAAQQGLGLYGNLQGIADEAQARPIRQKLAQIQLEAAQNKALLQPLESRRRLAELSVPIERSLGSGIEEVNRYPTVQEIGDDGQVITEQPAGVDVFSTQIVEVIDPATGERRQETRRARPLQTMEQGIAASELADNREQIAAIRLQQATTAQEAAQAKAENDRIKAEASRDRAALLASNPAVGFVDVKKADGRTYRQYFPKGDPSRIIHEIDRGVMASDILNFGGGIINVGGGQPVSPSAAGIDPDVAGIAASLGRATAPVAAPPPTRAAPRAAIDLLLQNPSLAPQFDAKYGRGAAQAVLTPSG